jgi:tetratricopeptide (TPR) repeat protein
MSAARARRERQRRREPKRQPRQPISRRRLWVFRLVVLVAAPILTLLLLEAGLRLAGYGFPTAVMVPRRIDGTACWCDNYRFAWRFFPPAIARTTESFAFPAVKADHAYRVFVLGESAAAGTPDGSYSFGRILQAMLRRQYPQTDFQVITVAMPAINSHVIRQIARDCARHQPDLFVIYMGNNEVVGPYGAGTVFAPLRSNLSVIRLGIAARATRVGQLIMAASRSLGGTPQTWQGMEMFLGHQVAAADPRLETVYGHFRANLEDICRLAGTGGIPVILCTVSSNLKDHAPFASQHRPNLTDAEKSRWETLYERGVAAETSGDWDGAMESYSAAMQVDDRYADLHFRMGRCYWQSGQFDKAKESFILARELDTLRFRADNRINEVIRDVAQELGGPTPNAVSLVDAVKLFEENSPHGTPGEALFYEHVHMNFSGNYLLARAVFEQVRKRLPNPAADAPASEAQCAEDLAYTVWDQCRMADDVLNSFIKRPPFTNQIDHSQQVANMERRIRGLKAALTAPAMSEVDRQYREAVERQSGDWWLHWNYGEFLEQTGSAAASAEQYRQVCRLMPQRVEAIAKLGQLAGQQGDLAAAVTYNREALRINPLCADAWFNLALAYHLQNKLDLSAEYYAKAIRCKSDHAQAYINLGVVLYEQGKTAQAIETYRRGLAAIPRDVELHCNLALMLVEQGQRQQGLQELAIAQKLDPNAPAVRKARDAIR